MADPASSWAEPTFTTADMDVQSDWTDVPARVERPSTHIYKSMLNGVWNKLDLASQKFLLSEPNLEVPEGESAYWEPAKLLGAGTFGVCGLWVKVNNSNSIIDEIVIKQVARVQPNEIRPHLVSEAVLQRDLQRHERERLLAESTNSDDSGNRPKAWTDRHIPHLRAYKYNTNTGFGRLHMEFCRHGDLSSLMTRYAAWSTHLPEGFLWWTLLSLARVATVMERPPHVSSLMHRARKPHQKKYPGPYGDDWFALHLDIKPENIMLRGPGIEPTVSGDDGPSKLPLTYPTIVLGDWGLAQYSTAVEGKDDWNPLFLHTVGTEAYMGPEQHVNCNGNILFVNFVDKPVEPETMKTSALNIFNVSKIIFDMMLGNCNHDFCDLAMRVPTEEQYKELGNHFIPHRNWGMGYAKRPDYSDALRDLVRRGLCPNPADRPSAAELERLALAGLRNFQNSLKGKVNANEDGELLERLYYRNNEIDDMPRGSGEWPVGQRLVPAAFATEDPDYPLIDFHVWGRQVHKAAEAEQKLIDQQQDRQPKHRARDHRLVKRALIGPDGAIQVVRFDDEPDSDSSGDDKPAPPRGELKTRGCANRVKRPSGRAYPSQGPSRPSTAESLPPSTPGDDDQPPPPSPRGPGKTRGGRIVGRKSGSRGSRPSGEANGEKEQETSPTPAENGGRPVGRGGKGSTYRPAGRTWPVSVSDGTTSTESPVSDQPSPPPRGLGKTRGPRNTVRKSGSRGSRSSGGVDGQEEHEPPDPEPLGEDDQSPIRGRGKRNRPGVRGGSASNGTGSRDPSQQPETEPVVNNVSASDPVDWGNPDNTDNGQRKDEGGEGDDISNILDTNNNGTNAPQLPDDATYNKMTIPEMRAELQHRNRPQLPKNTRKPGHLAALKEADQAGVYGRGAYGKKVPGVVLRNDGDEDEDGDRPAKKKQRKG